ncbi:MAG TPA: hypothetical protein PLR44_12180 [Thermomicrobiales bacterium]|nr:hypothetical protein [Thermomicrobiales bacterium]
MGKSTFAIALLAILTAVLLAVVTAGGDRDSIAGHIPGSRPPLPTTGLVPEGNNLPVLATVAPPDADSRPWLMQSPVRANAVLHWVESSAASGESTIVSEIWVQLDGDGVIKRLHTISTDSDGGFVQENGYEDRTAYTVWAAGTNQLHPGGAACVEAGSSPPPPGPAGPPFLVDAVTLQQYGFSLVTGDAPIVPTTPPLDGVEPRQSFSANGPLTTWEKRLERPGGGTTVMRGSIGAAQRGISSSLTELAADGSVIRMSEGAYGRLDVYDPAVVPNTVFAKVSTVEEQCHGPR